jgi:hypothetical protein
VSLVGRCRDDCRRCRHCRRMLALNDSLVTCYDVIFVVLIINKRPLMTLRRDLGIVIYVGVPTCPIEYVFNSSRQKNPTQVDFA